MTNDTAEVLSRDEISGLLASLDDPESIVRIAAIRALVRLPLDGDAQTALRPHRASVERRDYAWSTWLPTAANRARLGLLLDAAQSGSTARAQLLFASAQSSIGRRFAQLALQSQALQSSDMRAEAEAISAGAEAIAAEVERSELASISEVPELFAAYGLFAPAALRFWFDWTLSERHTYDPARELPSWFPLTESSLVAARQIEWLAARASTRTLLRGLDEPLLHGTSTERLLAAQLVEWARRAQAEPTHPRFGGGAGFADVLAPFPDFAEFKRFEPEELPMASAAWPPRRSATTAPETSLPVFGATAPALPTSGAEGERRINAWIGDSHWPEASPPAGTPCEIRFNVGAPVAAGLSLGAEARVDDAEIPAGGLDTCWTIAPQGAVLMPAGSSEVFVQPSGLAVFDLHIPRHGESATISLQVTRTLEAASLTVLIEVGDKLWRHLELSLDGRQAPVRDIASAPLADARLYTTHEWTTPPGELQLLVFMPSLAIVTGTQNGQRVNPGQTVDIGSDKALLSNAVDAVRRAADDFRKSGAGTAYLNEIDEQDLMNRLKGAFRPQYDWAQLEDLADDAHRAAWQAVSASDELRALAYYGRRLYDTLFPPGKPGRALLESLARGHRVNITWLPSSNAGWVAHVPWELLYAGDPSPLSDVDATAFWGLRHRIEYTAYEPRGAPSSRLGAPLEASCTSLLFFGDSAKEPATAEAAGQRAMWQQLGQHAKFAVLPSASGAGAKPELLRALAEPERVPGPGAAPVAVLYLFCHYGVDNQGKPILRFGLNSASAGDVIREPELGTAAIASRPLVFANACATAGTDVYAASVIAKGFFDRECRAFIGSEVMVPVPMASRLATVFFHFLLRQVDPARSPIAAGEAFAQARLFLWCHYRNIGGLLYAYLNQYDLYLASADELAALRIG
jgi:hypothetical protein